MEEDRCIPLILGPSFLKTACPIIDVDEEKLILRVGDESVEFNLSNKFKHPPEVKNAMAIKLSTILLMR